VFYGREAFPPEVDAASADAVLRGQGFGVSRTPGPKQLLGDLNGDGLADLVIPGTAWLHFIFGDEQRLSGEYALEELGVRWTGYGITRLASAGDVNGDGLGDFTMTLTTGMARTETANSVSFTETVSVFLFTGTEQTWPSGELDYAWATARFDPSGATQRCELFAAGDLDGDGYTDLLLSDGGTAVMMAGGEDALSGTMIPSEHGQKVQTFGASARPLPDLDGDGRNELSWSTFTIQMAYLTYGGQESEADGAAATSLSIRAIGLPLGGLDGADFNGDGRADVIATTGGMGAFTGGLYVLPGDGERWSGTRELSDDYLVLGNTNVDQAADEGLPGSFGLALQAGGDVNGDGFSEVLTLMNEGGLGAATPAYAVLIPGR
jgi:hypothetical protein